jgi:hypothetical protein
MELLKQRGAHKRIVEFAQKRRSRVERVELIHITNVEFILED